MTTVDFRSGGFQGARPQRYARDFPYGQNPQDAHHDADWHEEEWDDPRFAAAHAGVAAEPVSLIDRLSRLTHYLGALVSVALMVVLAVWGIKLVMRDVSGVPVIRAIEGAARTAPADPGGELTSRTGLAVNSVAGGAASRAVDKVAIAPEATGLASQDEAMGAFGATPQKPSHAVELPPLEDLPRVLPLTDGQSAAATESSTEPEAEGQAVVSEPIPADAPVNEALTDLAGQQTQDMAIIQALAEANEAPESLPVAAAVQQSARPMPRPRRLAANEASAASRPAAASSTEAEAPVQAPAPDPAPAKVAPGAIMVQIGAFDSDAIAKGEWQRVSGKFGDIFSGKSRVVQEAQSGGRTFWRLRAAGFGSKDEARKFCAALIAKGVDCIPAMAN